MSMENGNRKVRVLECIRQGLIGGGESHLLVLVANLDKEKYYPVVLSFTDGPMIDKLKAEGIETHIIETNKAFDVFVWSKIKAFLKIHQIDVIHAHGSRANSNLIWAAKALKIPVVYTIHGWSFHQDQSKVVRGLRVFGEGILTKYSSRNISVSESNKATGKRYLKNFESIVVNNGIDQKRFNPDNRFKDIRAELGLPKDKILLLFLARFTSHKQPLTLLEAFENVVKKNNNIHLLLVGEGDEKAAGELFVKEKQLENSVTFSSFRLDVPDVIANADIYILPSLWEGLPIGLLEAMAMGKSVIATNVDGSKDVIKDGENGLLVETDGLIRNLEEKILLLSQNKELRNKLEAGAIKTVNEKYEAVGMTRKIERVYDELVNN